MSITPEALCKMTEKDSWYMAGGKPLFLRQLGSKYTAELTIKLEEGNLVISTCEGSSLSWRIEDVTIVRSSFDRGDKIERILIKLPPKLIFPNPPSHLTNPRLALIIEKEAA